jgi:hypothetical protein
MVFRDKYELLAIRGGDLEIALPGREISSARPVLVHLLAGGYAPENQELLRAVGNLSADQRKHVLDTGDHDGIPYVVTDTLPDNLLLRSWVAAAIVEQPRQSREPSAQAGTPYAEPGEFTRLFQGAEKPPAPTRAAAPAKLADAPARPEEQDTATMAKAATTEGAAPAAAPAEPEFGEFTRLLRAPSAGPKAPAPPKGQEAAAPSGAPPNEPAAEPGEFTSMFQSQPPDAAASGPGEFTRAMRPPLAGESNYTKPAAPAAPPSSEFTRIMRGSPLPPPPETRQGPSPQAQPRESLQSQGEFTRIFEAEPSPAGNLTAPAASQAPLPRGGLATGAFSRDLASAGSGAPSGESEFTKMIARPSPPPVAAAPKAPQPPAGRFPPLVKTKQSYLPLILILAGLFLLVVILIVVFAVMH